MNEQVTKYQCATPRTDAVAFMITNERVRREAVFADFARQIERELTEAVAEVDRLRIALNVACGENEG